MEKKQEHLETLNVEKINIITSSAFFISLQAALLAYINSFFLKQYLPVKDLGYIYIAGSLVSILIIINLTKIIEKFGRYKTFITCFLVNFISLVGLAVSHDKFLVVSFFLLYNLSLFVSYIGIDVFTEAFSSDTNTGEIKGRQFTIKNLAWVVAPIISGHLLESYGFNLIFFISALSMFLATIIFSRIKKHQHITIKDNGLKHIFKKIINNKNIFNIVILALFLEIFFAVMVVYMPLYLQSIGLAWSQIGIIFTIMLTPFVIFQYPIGRIIDKKHAEKEILTIGLFIVGISSCLIFLVNFNVVWVWAILLFINRIGACFVQITIDGYFYKQIDCRDVDLINFFFLTKPLGVMIVALSVSLLLFFVSLHYIFLILGIFVLSGLWFVSKIDDSK